ncbi:hypothetical protein E4P42_01200 [Mycobacterium sp. PS03-16]|uniref:hypothetical protein n=1 Tax=Mycobacterium sp. PS03-16 TaxID=2559611 RepID=UPI0010735E2A|nr:hypothetical protein [Mycobacterium sp. PS03-16]TFV61541.1 hypothetical protein E4P42_01200 [Mycobacterium sp. PS03-16]
MGDRRSGGAGFGSVFAALVLLGLVVEYFWWIVAGAAVVASVVAVVAVSRRMHERSLAAAERDAEVAQRAEQQHRWTLRGDSRGVYGPDGATAMESLAVADGAADDPPVDPSEVATVASTPADLQRLVTEKPPCWRWAAFASVLVQRRRPLMARLRDSALGFMTATGPHLCSGRAVGHFVVDRMDDMMRLAEEVESFLSAPAFAATFDYRGEDESVVDADAVLQVANRLMDYHDRFLGVSEMCRGATTSGPYADVIRDCARLADMPLQSYGAFIDEFVERVGEMPEMMRHARGTVKADPVILDFDIDDRLIDRIVRRAKALSAY